MNQNFPRKLLAMTMSCLVLMLLFMGFVFVGENIITWMMAQPWFADTMVGAKLWTILLYLAMMLSFGVHCASAVLKLGIAYMRHLNSPGVESERDPL